jgi:hypothetical protein
MRFELITARPRLSREFHGALFVDHVWAHVCAAAATHEDALMARYAVVALPADPLAPLSMAVGELALVLAFLDLLRENHWPRQQDLAYLRAMRDRVRRRLRRAVQSVGPGQARLASAGLSDGLGCT